MRDLGVKLMKQPPPIQISSSISRTAGNLILLQRQSLVNPYVPATNLQLRRNSRLESPKESRMLAVKIQSIRKPTHLLAKYAGWVANQAVRIGAMIMWIKTVGPILTCLRLKTRLRRFRSFVQLFIPGLQGLERSLKQATTLKPTILQLQWLATLLFRYVFNLF